MKHRILLAAGVTYLCAANLIWIGVDTRPPFWDMANHQRYALNIYETIAADGPAGLVRAFGLTEFYPPFYHFIVAAFYAFAGRHVDAAALANLPAILILALSTYTIGRTILSPSGAAVAGILANFYPLMVWMSRETLIDYWLTAMVALAMWLLLQTRSFSERKWSMAFGVCCGLGMLTKPAFALFLALPAFWFARGHWKQALPPAAIAAGITALWYVPGYSALRTLSTINVAGASAEGDPVVFSWQSVVFYWRALEGYQLFLPLFLCFLAGAWMLARHFKAPWLPIVLWAAGGWVLLMLLPNKDPRYSAPLLPAVALVTANFFERRQRLLVLLVPLVLFQHYMISFGVPRLPENLVILRGIDGSLEWHWYLYTQTYFGLWGPPAREDWQIDRVLDRVADPDRPVSIGMVPDIPRFDYAAFDLAVALRKLNIKVHRITSLDKEFIVASDYLIVSEAGAASYSAPHADAIQSYIHEQQETFRKMDTFSLPNGETIHLYRVFRP